LNQTIFQRDDGSNLRSDKITAISNKLINNRMEMKTIDLIDQINESGIISKVKREQIEEFVTKGLNVKKNEKNKRVVKLENQMIIDQLPGSYQTLKTSKKQDFEMEKLNLKEQVSLNQ